MKQNRHERRKSAVDLKAWQSRRDMVSHAMSISINWFIFVNISFALMIYWRNVLFNDFDRSLHVTLSFTAIIDRTMVGIIIGSLFISGRFSLA